MKKANIKTKINLENFNRLKKNELIKIKGGEDTEPYKDGEANEMRSRPGGGR